MLQFIFSLLIIPFIPLWVFWSVFNNEKNKLGEGGGLSVVEEQSRQLAANNSPNTPENQSAVANIFPVDNSASSGIMPVKNENSQDLKIWAGSSVAIDSSTGNILHYDNGKNKIPIASLTKIMTAVVIMEHLQNLNEEVIITRESLMVPGTVVGCPRTGFCPSNRMYVGEKVKAIDLMKAMLMNSANDAATALGIHIAGSEDKFVEIMNDKAQSLGFKDTHFCTPSGLEIDGQEAECYSTAYDIARIAAYSLKYDKIWEIMRIPEDRFYSTNGKYMHELKNTDLLLGSLPNCLGGKTGFTPAAGKSLLVATSDFSGKHKIIAVLLNDETRWDDMKTLNDWIFKSYIWK
ncbi:MAG: hypothetical protein NTZ97_01105 [Candidatus Moranbacteria bacterium]|nr:hypothetical protein [Candidatus Moranbacteria bacterium]